MLHKCIIVKTGEGETRGPKVGKTHKTNENRWDIVKSREKLSFFRKRGENVGLSIFVKKHLSNHCPKSNLIFKHLESVG